MIGFRGAGTFATRASPGTGALSVGVPAGTAAGDFILMPATSYNSPGDIGINTPAGWTLIATKPSWVGDYRSALFGKVAGASEAAASLSSASSSYLDAVTVGFTGVDNTTPIDVVGSWALESSLAAVTVPSITTVTPDAWWLFFTADAVGQLNSSSVPSGWTQRALTAITIVKYAISSVLVPSSGATSATSFARTGSSMGQTSLGLALRPAGSAFTPRIAII